VTVSQPDSKSTKPTGILVRKPTSTIYTALLGVALVALTFGSFFLLMELFQYFGSGMPWNPRP
jgi:hypothetical protein